MVTPVRTDLATDERPTHNYNVAVWSVTNKMLVEKLSIYITTIIIIIPTLF